MAIVQNPKALNLEDIQGIIMRGYAKLQHTAYILLAIEDAQKAKNWLKARIPEIDAAADHTNKSHRTVHVGLAYSGFQKLGLESENLRSFPIAFQEGLNTPYRNRTLGDLGNNAPELWRWGKETIMDMVLVLHAASEEDLNSFITEHQALLDDNSGINVSYQTIGFLPDDNKEPFGFHDGISQPVIKGSGRPGPENDLVEPGEFLLGYSNEHGLFPDSPLIHKTQGDTSLLEMDKASGLKDLGRNGSFMVFRQLEQHVDRFWKFMEDQTKNDDGTVNEAAKVKLAAKCVGRWPSGASLVEFPEADPGGSPSNDDFGYADTDPEGMKCPFGSHLRRCNPRDTHRFYDKKQSLKITKRHRIIRRGRNYTTINEQGNTEIGLQFVCFNANLELQYEFIQREWANNNQMRHLTNDIDPIIGVPPEGNPNNTSREFTIQASPVNQTITDVEQFVTVKGGGYFFMPSLRALNYLTTL